MNREETKESKVILIAIIIIALLIAITAFAPVDDKKTSSAADALSSPGVQWEEVSRETTKTSRVLSNKQAQTVKTYTSDEPFYLANFPKLVGSVAQISPETMMRDDKYNYQQVCEDDMKKDEMQCSASFILIFAGFIGEQNITITTNRDSDAQWETTVAARSL